jgi:hypothetical protein
MPENGVKNAALAIVQHESHRVILAVDFGAGAGEHMNGRIAGQAGVELVGGFESSEAFGGGVFRIGNLDTKWTVRIVRPGFGIPDAAREVLELGPSPARRRRRSEPGLLLSRLQRSDEDSPGLRGQARALASS